MRDWWYGDKRDVVKWATVLVLARKWDIKRALQVAFYRADGPSYRLTIEEDVGTTEPVPVEVVRHFRDINHIQRLADTANLKIDIHNDTFQGRGEFRTRDEFREAYFNELARKIKRYRKPIIVFLDPDTGIAPKTYSYEHITSHEIHTVLKAMNPNDILLFYQHARRRDREWLNSTRDEFRQAVGINVPIHTITCNAIANDVAFFALERSKWVQAKPAK